MKNTAYLQVGLGSTTFTGDDFIRILDFLEREAHVTLPTSWGSARPSNLAPPAPGLPNQRVSRRGSPPSISYCARTPSLSTPTGR